jgi:hypothetical protein
MTATLIRFPVERIGRHKVFAADAVVVPMQRRPAHDPWLVSDATFMAMVLSFQMLFDLLEGK